MSIQLAVPVVGSAEEAVNGCGICQEAMLATATNSTCNPAAGPGDPAFSNIYLKNLQI